MNKKRILTAALGLFLIAPTAMQAATTYETNVDSGVNFRNKPSTNSYIYRLLPKGEDIHVIQKENNYWLKVQVKDGTIGYISANAKYTDYKPGTTSTGGSTSNGSTSGTDTTVNISKADSIIALSKSLQGKVTYKFGVRDTSKMIFDCSSFTQYVFAQNDVKISWGTKTQQTLGQAVSKGSLKKGDLVFFATTGSSINHVGIYIGGGEFIHNTPSKNGISINTLNSGYWSDHYKSARRIL